MSRGRRRRQELESAPASTLTFWSIVVNGVFLVVFAAALAGFTYLVWIGWWASPLELLVAFVLNFAAVVGLLFFADGIRRDVREAGWSTRGELRALARRVRRSSSRPSGRESFASQRFTGNARRRR